MNNIFVLASCYYEEYTPYYFLGPKDASQEDFNKLCHSLLERAGLLAIQRQKMSMYPSFVGMKEVVEEISNILPEFGYEKFIPDTVDFFGPGILDSLDSLKEFGGAIHPILDFNSDIIKNNR